MGWDEAMGDRQRQATDALARKATTGGDAVAAGRGHGGVWGSDERGCGSRDPVVYVRDGNARAKN